MPRQKFTLIRKPALIFSHLESQIRIAPAAPDLPIPRIQIPGSMIPKRNPAALDHRSCTPAALDLQIPRNQIPGSPIPKRNPHHKQNHYRTTPRWMITFICFSLLILKSALPTTAQPASARVSFTPDGPSNAVGVCHVTLHDSTGVQSIEVELTDLMKKEVLFIREYTFDQTSGLPTGITWHREGTKVQMGLGTLPTKLAWQGKVRLKDGSGQWGEAYTFLFN